jgi:hypothetical protein
MMGNTNITSFCRGQTLPVENDGKFALGVWAVLTTLSGQRAIISMLSAP